MASRKDIYSPHAASIAQRIFLSSLAAAYVVLAWWLLFSGIPSLGARFHHSLTFGDTTRRFFLGAALSVYFIRLLFTQFAFLKRALSWTEATTVGSWLLVIYLLFSIAGGTNPAQAYKYLGLGAILFLLGSWMNSYAEYARHKWKQQPGNCGRLYTHGLFRYTRHPNYLGDLISFTGLSFISGRWIGAAIPAIMLVGFVFVNIPMLDAHLHDHYGAAFDDYAKRTRKLIPFVY